jgi:predicted nuclease with TOPRIM domain
MDNPLVMQIVLGLLVLLALVFGGLSFKNWRAWDVIGGFLVFASAVTFLVFLSVSLKARRHWLQKLDGYQKEHARLLDEQEKLLHGDLAAVTQTAESLRSISAKLSRFMVDRGRIWRDCVPAAPAGDGTITVAGAEAGKPHQIPPNFILHAFREQPLQDGMIIPATYIGEFLVVASDDVSVQLRPTLLSPSLLASSRSNPNDFQINFGAVLIANATWSLYEMLPPDGHRVFVDMDVHPDLSIEGAPAFGQVKQEEVQAVFQFVMQHAFPTQQPPPQNAVLQALQQIVRDGLREEPTDPQDRIQVKVRFVKDHTEKVDTDVAQDILSDTFFDSQGQAQVDFLRRGDDGTVTLKPGAVVILRQDVANQLIRDGVCEAVERVYIRQLHDFSTAMHTLFDRWVDAQKETRGHLYNIAQMQTVNQQTSQMIQSRQDERTKLETDLQKVGFERDQMQALGTALETHLNNFRDEIRGLLAMNLALEEELETLQRRITEQVERAVDQAVAAP